MPRTAVFFLVAVLCLPASAFADDASPTQHKSYTIGAAIDRGLDLNERIISSRYDIEAAQDEQGATRAQLLPHAFFRVDTSNIDNSGDMETDSDYLTQDSTTQRFGVEQPLVDLPAFFRFRAAQKNTEYTRLGYSQQRLDLAQTIFEEYLLLLEYVENEKSYQKSVERLEAQQRAVKAMYERQLKPRLDLLQAQSELAKARQQHSAIQNRVKIQRTRLCYLLALPRKSCICFAGDLSTFRPTNLPSLDELSATAFKNRPDLMQLEKTIEILNDRTSEQGSAFLPRVSLSAQRIQQDINYESSRLRNVDREYYTVGLNLTWDFFESGRSLYATRSQHNKKISATHQLADLKNSIHTEVQENYLKVSEAQKQVELSKLYLDEAQETFRRARMSYRLGLGTSVDFLTASAGLVEAEVLLNKSRAEYQIALSELYRAAGLLDKIRSLAEV